MRKHLACLLLLLGSGTAQAFSIVPVPGAPAGMPSFVATGGAAALPGGSPFFGTPSPTLSASPIPVDASAFGGGWSFRQGSLLYGSQSFAAGPALSLGGLRSFGIMPGFSNNHWTVDQTQFGYLVSDNLLLYSSVAQARRHSPSLTGLPIAPGLTTLEDQRGPTAARAGVQWQAMPGLTLGVEVSGIRGVR